MVGNAVGVHSEMAKKEPESRIPVMLGREEKALDRSCSEVDREGIFVQGLYETSRCSV